MAQVIAVANQKGGVGKSTLVLNCGAIMAQKGYRVLVIDSDAQFNLTTGLGVDPSVEAYTLADVYDTNRPVPLSKTIRKTMVKGLELVPSHLDLTLKEVELFTAMSREYLLKNALNVVLDDYDYVLIDCPPDLGILTLNALVAATDILIPIDPGKWALQGITSLAQLVSQVKAKCNPGLKILGVVMNKATNNNFSRDVLAGAKAMFEGTDLVFDEPIPLYVDIQRSAADGRPVTEFAPGSKATQIFEATVNTLLTKLRATAKVV